MDSTHLTRSPLSSQIPPISEIDEKIYEQENHSNNDSSSPAHQRPRSEFDPFSNAKIASPFYLYNHDSPRPSYDGKPRTPNKSINVSIRDLEAGESDAGLTPTVTQEKRSTNPDCRKADSGKLRLWGQRKRCMTKPRQNKWFSTLPRWQKLTIKLLIALLIIGAVVGVAVGVSVKVHGGIWKNSNQTTDIGN